MSETMRAIGIHDYGGPEALELLRVPVPGSGELLPDVTA